MRKMLRLDTIRLQAADTTKNLESLNRAGSVELQETSKQLWEIIFTAVGLTQKNFASCAVHQQDGEDVSRQVGKTHVETFPID